MPLILGIETSCDECSAALVEHQKDQGLSVRSVATHSQTQIHNPYGGVVPEIASRNHLETINQMVDSAIAQAGVTYQDVDAISVTNRPGLIGALLVGVSAAKALSYSLRSPLVPVHHLEGHASSIFLDQNPKIDYPLLLGIVSGGHTNLYVIKSPPLEWEERVLQKSMVARSIDDAAGEAFDKTGKLLDFPYPAGIHIDKNSRGGRPDAYPFPRALREKANLNFSFSGLKTAVSLQIKTLKEKSEFEESKQDLCASIQEAIVDSLWKKTVLAAERFNCRAIAIVGGVAANSRLRERLTEAKLPVFFPKPEFCTDNAAMIAGAGAFRFSQGHFLRGGEILKLHATANSEV